MEGQKWDKEEEEEMEVGEKGVEEGKVDGRGENGMECQEWSDAKAQIWRRRSLARGAISATEKGLRVPSHDLILHFPLQICFPLFLRGCARGRMARVNNSNVLEARGHYQFEHLWQVVQRGVSCSRPGGQPLFKHLCQEVQRGVEGDSEEQGVQQQGGRALLALATLPEKGPLPQMSCSLPTKSALLPHCHEPSS
ncbi:hypothetical protein BDK51DRAFT_33855 [Blyttiomyces helicus]|uniref:Uncharacterized protein n=1 Tax=Blyttiomyces helicus TaxID=388810 RepID=A0A4P9WJL7_9FUNG|nr:hypothetical protein BDK51DRAFT_33855 [Blyttiomyces helicus]|eukprot:RKO92255.1 hypothetical protein BDK51DRAFT_33855 [Blyttiomyces helicus]